MVAARSGRGLVAQVGATGLAVPLPCPLDLPFGVVHPSSLLGVGPAMVARRLAARGPPDVAPHGARGGRPDRVRVLGLGRPLAWVPWGVLKGSSRGLIRFVVVFSGVCARGVWGRSAPPPRALPRRQISYVYQPSLVSGNENCMWFVAP